MSAQGPPAVQVLLDTDAAVQGRRLRCVLAGRFIPSIVLHHAVHETSGLMFGGSTDYFVYDVFRYMPLTDMVPLCKFDYD